MFILSSLSILFSSIVLWKSFIKPIIFKIIKSVIWWYLLSRYYLMKILNKHNGFHIHKAYWVNLSDNYVNIHKTNVYKIFDDILKYNLEDKNYIILFYTIRSCGKMYAIQYNLDKTNIVDITEPPTNIERHQMHNPLPYLYIENKGKDITDTLCSYLGPDKDGYKNIQGSSFNTSAMIDINGNLLIDKDDTNLLVIYKDISQKTINANEMFHEYKNT